MPDVKEVVVNALSEALKDDAATDLNAKMSAGEDVDIANLDLDSLSRFEVMMRIEEVLDIELDDDELLAQETVSALISFIAARTGSGE